MRYIRLLLVSALFCAVLATAREFRLEDIYSGRESLSNVENGDEIVLNAHQNPPVRILWAGSLCRGKTAPFAVSGVNFVVAHQIPAASYLVLSVSGKCFA